MSVRAKMRVVELSDRTNVTSTSGQVETKYIRFQAVYGTGEDDSNKEWSKWTPSGELTMTVTNPEAFNQFQIGKAYFVDISPADP